MHSERNSILRRRLAAFALPALTCATLALAGCTNQYRPVVSSINPVGPAGQPTKFAAVISTNGNVPGLVNVVDFAGDQVLDTTLIGVNPRYLILDTSAEAYVLNGDGTLNSFAVSTSLLRANVNTSSLPANANPVALLPINSNLYLTETGRNSIAQLTGLPPAVRQELPSGSAPIYTVGATNAPRVYGLVPSTTAGAPGSAVAIETSSNTVSSTIPVGVNPVYGVMTADGRRAFILNNGSNTVSVLNTQTNAPDTFASNGVVTGTIPVGVAPVWAEFAPTLNEVLVANAGNGVTPGTVSIISIPLCSQTSVANNPNCDVNNPIDAVGFGQVIATVQVGISPVVIGVLQDGTQAYVANAGNAAAGIAGSVSVINLLTNTVTNTIAAGNSTLATDGLIHGHPNFLAVTTGTPTGKVYITAGDSTDLTILRTDTNLVQTHVPLQGQGVMVRVTAQ